MSETRTSNDVEAARWNAVVDATSAGAQAEAVEAFIASLPQPSNGRPVSFQLGATDAVTGGSVSIPDAMAAPSQHEVTVRVDGASYRFKPLSEASLTPFMARVVGTDAAAFCCSGNRRIATMTDKPQFETDEVSATRGREQGLGVGARELAAQRDAGGVVTPDEDDDEDALERNTAVQGDADEDAAVTDG